jgi:hypothetical protein
LQMATKKTARPRNRRTQAQIFLDKLKQLGGDKAPVGNITLRETLGWEEIKYRRIHRELADQQRLIAGRGKGGSVMLASLPGTKGLTIFISYSHVDEAFKNDLVKHLDPLRRLGLIETWHDRKIKPGEVWGNTISANLEKAQIILLLVSIDFINSEYCYDTELERALERNDAGKAKVIPIILRACMWQQTPFAKLQGLPKDGQAVALWPDRDAAFVNIAEGIRQVARDLLETA